MRRRREEKCEGEVWRKGEETRGKKGKKQGEKRRKWSEEVKARGEMKKRRGNVKGVVSITLKSGAA